jgi:hypothetical protein
VLFDMGADTGQVIIDDVSLFGEGGGPDVGTPIDPDAALYLTDGEPDLVVPNNYSELTAFDSLSVIEENYVDDDTYSPVLSVFSGVGYGANIAQAGYIGFAGGFLTKYESLVFKVKGMPNLVVFVKLFDNLDALRISLSSSAFSSDLGDGWFQVSIPLSRFDNLGAATGIVFESDDSAATPFRMLLTDIGFTGTGDRVPTDTGIVPEVGAYASDPDAMNEDLAPPGGIQNFGSGAVITDVLNDLDFSRVLQVTSGDAYDPGNVEIGFAAFTGYEAGFATGYETLHFKVKGDAANLANFEVKFFAGAGEPETSQTYDATSFTDLGNGWYQVSIPTSDFNATLATNTGFLLGPFGDQGTRFTFLMTDIGFSGTVDPGPGPGDELLVNGDFEASAVEKTGWIGAGVVVTNNYYTAEQAVPDQPPFTVNLSQVLTIAPGANYVLTFRAKASVERSMLAGIGLNEAPWSAATVSVPLTTEWQSFSYDLSANNDADGVPFGNDNSRVLFDMGAEVGVVNIDDVSLTLVGDGAELLTNGGFEAAAPDKAPWFGAGEILTNIYYEAEQATPNQPPFTVNLSQVLTITPAADYVLTFRARASVERGMLAGIGLNEAPWSAATVPVTLTTEWQSFSYELSANNDADGVPFGNDNSRVLFDMGAEVGVVNIDDVSLTLAGGGGGGGGGDIAVNGGFETGDFTGWEQFPGGGVQAVTNVNPSSGTFAANLNIPVIGAGGVGVDNIIKNANLEAGNLAPNAAVTVSFDLRGSLSGAGGVVFAELFSELAGGGTSKAEILGGGPLTPADAWTPYSFNTTLGPDVAGGVTLQLKVGCGAVEGCGADVYFDNVSIVIN